jgi:heme-degrading monooxygenase HmoA
MSFVAISKVRYPPCLKDKIHEFCLEMLPMAKLQPGFISIRFHQSQERNETMMYWEWGSQSDHEACMQSKDWCVLMDKSGSLLQSSGVEFTIKTYERLA